MNSRILSVVLDDIKLLLIGTLAGILLLILPLVNPPTQAEHEQDYSPGNLTVRVVWPGKLGSDVDVWFLGPKTKGPVWFRERDQGAFSLLRDDVGHANEETMINEEFVFSRGLPEGEYQVNLHLYRLSEGEGPIPVEVEVAVRNPDGVNTRIDKHTVELLAQKDEKTIVRFTLNEHGILVGGSLHRDPRSLVTMRGNPASVMETHP